MPLFSDDSSRRFTVEHFRRFKQADRASTIDVLLAILRHPDLLVLQIVTPIGAKLKYLFYHWLPLAFVPAISWPAWIMAGFPILALFIRDPNAPGDPLSIHIRYAITVVPGLFYGTILWWSHHAKQFKPRFRLVWIGCMILSLLFVVRHNPHNALYFLGGLKPFTHHHVEVSLARQWQHAASLHALMNQIPAEASVAASTYTAPHLSSRREVIRFLAHRKQGATGNGVEFFPATELRNDSGVVVQVDYILTDLWQLQHYQTVDDSDRKRLQAVVPMIDRVLQDGLYGLCEVSDGAVLLQKGVASNQQALTSWSTLKQALSPALQH